MKLINRVRCRASPAGCALWLASASTATALSISVLAGWQRGGWFAERIAWVAIGAVLVVSAHLLPALYRSAGVGLRCIGAALWATCMVATCYGHATFFLLAQQHAGTNRVNVIMPTVTTTSVPAPVSGRALAAIATERATVTTALAVANAQRCTGECPTLRVRRISLAARLDALNAKADDTKRELAEYDRRVAWNDREIARRDDLRDSLRDDPVTHRLAALLGTTTGRVDLFSGLAFAGVLEGVACLLWCVALQSLDVVADAATGAVAPVVATVAEATASASSSVTASRLAVSSGQDAVPVNHALPDDHATGSPVTQPVDVTRLRSDIAAGLVRATVADIRRHLGCSQARAAALRRQLAERNVTA
jgi:hypothetical protein